jgi:hypothetical protein
MATASPKAPVTAFIPNAPPVLPPRGLLLEDEVVAVVEPLVAVAEMSWEVVDEPEYKPVDELALPPLSCKYTVRSSHVKRWNHQLTVRSPLQASFQLLMEDSASD